MVDARSKAGRSRSTWLGYGFGAVALVALIWYPAWTLWVALGGAALFEFFPDADEPATTGTAFPTFAWGTFLLCIELANWWFRYADEVPFRYVLFPTDDTPADLRFILLGWLLIFNALIGRARKLFAGDTDTEPTP